MERLFFEDIESFVDEITENYDSIINEDETISIIAKYEEARKIIKELVFLDWNLRDITLIDNAYGEYDDEYVISLSSTPERYEVWCEPMKKYFGYLDAECFEVYVLDNCSSKVIPHCYGEENYEVTIGECCEPACDECCGCCDCDCDGEELYVDEFNGMHGFEVHRSDDDGYCKYTFYSSDKDLVTRLAEILK